MGCKSIRRQNSGQGVQEMFKIGGFGEFFRRVDNSAKENVSYKMDYEKLGEL